MNRLQLAKLVESAGVLKTRKRLQKVVYLLQAAGCRLDVDFTLHHYGPYSHGLSQLADDMVRVGLLEEDETPNAMVGRSFSYRLSDRARQQLTLLPQGAGSPLGLGRFERLAKELLAEPDLPKLEYASTVAYFRKQRDTWDEAREAAANFKGQNAYSPVMRDAEQLARRALSPEESG